MRSLPVLLRLSDRPVILLGDGETAEAKRRMLIRAEARPVNEDDGEARIAIVALDDDEEARSAVARLKQRGILVNATDRPDLCDFTLPSIVDRDPVIIAIGTSGASAGLAKALRLLLEAMLPPSLGALARGLKDARARIRTRWPDAAARRQAIDAALAPGGLLDPLSGAAEEEVEHWLAASDSAPDPTSETIAIRSADPDDLTLREARWLGRADRIFHQPDIPAAILDRARADAARYPATTPPEPGDPGFTLWIRWCE
ncbi:MAG: bifunctional precorrin-2 dehydrogenase/sirohydrochlorin ferrochelatase [Sphingomonadaceae bacterium]